MKKEKEQELYLRRICEMSGQRSAYGSVCEQDDEAESLRGSFCAE